MARTIKNKRKLNKKTTNKLKISRQNYSPHELQEAVEMVNSKQMSLRVAAAAYGVPSTTISDHKNKVSKSNKIEKLLVDGLIKLGDWGFGLSEFMKLMKNQTIHLLLIFRNNQYILPHLHLLMPQSLLQHPLHYYLLLHQRLLFHLPLKCKLLFDSSFKTQGLIIFIFYFK